MAEDVFADFRADEAPKEAAFKRLDELVKLLTKAEADVVAAQAVLKQAQERVRQLDEFDIPEHMDSLGLTEFTNRAGIKIEAQSTIRASIGDRKAQAFAWLMKNGHGGIIKRNVTVAFNTTQAEDAKALLKELEGRTNLNAAGIKGEMKVEAASLTAFVRKQLKAGKQIPHDIFGIFDQRSTKITLPSE